MKIAECPWCGHEVTGCGKRCENCRAVVYCRDSARGETGQAG